MALRGFEMCFASQHQTRLEFRIRRLTPFDLRLPCQAVVDGALTPGQHSCSVASHHGFLLFGVFFWEASCWLLVADAGCRLLFAGWQPCSVHVVLALLLLLLLAVATGTAASLSEPPCMPSDPPRAQFAYEGTMHWAPCIPSDPPRARFTYEGTMHGVPCGNCGNNPAVIFGLFCCRCGLQAARLAAKFAKRSSCCCPRTHASVDRWMCASRCMRVDVCV